MTGPGRNQKSARLGDQIRCDPARLGICRVNVVKGGKANRNGAVHGFLNNARNVEEADAPAQKACHRNLIRSIKNSRSGPSRLQGLPGEPEGGKAHRIRGLKAQIAKRREIEAR